MVAVAVGEGVRMKGSWLLGGWEEENTDERIEKTGGISKERGCRVFVRGICGLLLHSPQELPGGTWPLSLAIAYFPGRGQRG